MNSKKEFIPVGLISIFILISLFSCSKETDGSKEAIVTIASVKKIPSFQTWLGCYWMKEEGSNEWNDGWEIRGFEHQDGHEYRLRIYMEKWPDSIMTIVPLPPYQYTLLEILSDQEKESEGIPDQYLIATIASRKSEKDHYFVSFGVDWEEIPDILDFEYEEGYEYRGCLSARFMGQQAQPRYTYYCQDITTKEEKDSERLPENKVN